MVAKETKTSQKIKAVKAERYSMKGESLGKESLPDAIFAHESNDNLIAQYIRVYLYNQRQGTVSAQTRAEVTGSTKKVWRQKGTGRARHGAAKANLFVGGGVTFGPKPREFSKSLNKKQKKLALFIALSDKARSGSIKILESKELGKEPKTKMVAAALPGMKIEGRALFVLSKVEKNPFVLSARNIQGIDIMQATTINPYEVLNHSYVVFVDDALEALVTHFLKTDENK